MTTPLLPIVVETCQNGRRERRPSSVNSLSALRSVPFSDCPPGEESAIVDDHEPSGTASSFFSNSISISPALPLPEIPPKLVSARHYHNANADRLPSPSTCILGSRASLTTMVTSNVNIGLERLRWRLASGFFAYFLCGWGDGVTGTVLPYLMANYQISYMMSASLYAASTIGFMSGTFLVEMVVTKLGCFDLEKRHWSWVPCTNFVSWFSSKSLEEKKIGHSPSQARLLSLFLSSTLHAMFFVMMGTEAGFWISFGAYAVAAFARSLLTAALNSYFSSGPRGAIGYAFGLWSFGGVISPLVCQTAVAAGIPWPKFYFGSLLLSASNVVFLFLAFRPTSAEFIRDRRDAKMRRALAESNNESPENAFRLDTESKTSEKGEPGKIPANRKSLATAVKLPYQWAVCLFAFVYCGCETATQSFMVSYLLVTRDANPHTVGYVTSGFWGGITVGRCVWGHFTPRLTYTQRRFVIQGCIDTENLNCPFLPVVGLIMQILIWKIDSDVANSLSTGVIGMAYGPVFPACLTLVTDILPREIQMVSMALVSASGSAGAAIFPFVAGTVSSSNGVQSLVYITVPLASAIACLWIMFPPRITPRAEGNSLS